MHITRHLEGCTKHITSKDAHNKAPRRMHTPKHPEVYTHIQHLEGCIQRVISKDARTKASRRMHTEREPEGCAIRSPGKGNRENTYTSRSIAKVTFGRKRKRGYNESRPDQHKYSATLHPGRARLKASQLIDTLELFASYSMGILTNKF